MKRFLMLVMIAITCLSFMATVAEAKRFGGGSSFGKSRYAPTKQAQRAPDAKPVPSSGASKWMGPLAGLAIGAALASMFTGTGFGGAMSSIFTALAIAAAVMFLISRFKKSQHPNMQYAGAAYRAPLSNSEPTFNTSSGQANASNSIPQGFPVDSFLRNAKASFIRLQAANDKKDINDVREYTTPEVFAEISMQMQERGNTPQTTEIISINAELLEVANEGGYSIASVRFTGQLRENNGIIENIDETWHIQKQMSDTLEKWLLAGIQQSS